MQRLIAILLFFSTVVVAAPFSHEGLFANAAVGLGYASFDNANGKESLIAEGLGVKLHGKLGYYVVQNLALHANLGYTMYSNFRESLNGISVYSDHDFYVLNSVYLGAGATYYVPAWKNVFISGSLGVTGYELDCRKYSGNTGLRAFSFDVGFGREWWLNERYALGASISFDSGDYWSDDDGVFHSSSIMLMLSVSFN